MTSKGYPMFGNIYGLDLGTYEIKVYDKKQDAIWKEKNTIAIRNKREIFSVGDAAYEMYEKAPYNIEIVFPMKEGVISRFYDMQYLLENLLKKERPFIRGSKYVIAVPTDVTEVEKKAFYDLVNHSSAKAKEVRIVEKCIADAIGLGLPIQASPGIFIVNLGGETTELSVMASGGVVLNRILKMGGNMLDQSIVNQIRYTMDFLTGRPTGELLRKHFGICDETQSSTLKISGRNLMSGIPELKEIPASIVCTAMKDSLESCVREIKVLLERTPPEVLRSIQRSGIYLTGGLANLAGLSQYIEGYIGLKVNTIPEPELCTIRGLKQIIQSKELKQLTYSMLDENYGWMK